MGNMWYKFGRNPSDSFRVLIQKKWVPCIKIGDRKIDNFLLRGKLIKQIT